ncbi:RluA family pseudouridine synthase [Desulfogranum mediterraneum]|uniref:RluA family pseudouridine synthase n=1 Tax=Desulfogranum mediterraneum TaxID=160661 RepID=UPI000408DA4C|nr:RluA family pseudouridine synthase [Desulfogranum mediterraneum]
MPDSVVVEHISSAGDPEQPRHYLVQSHEAKQRLDHYLVRQCPDFSRSYITKLILAEDVLVDGQPAKAGCRLRAGNRVAVRLPPPQASHLVGEDVDFELLFEDEQLLIIAKPPGIVVHPAAGHQGGTLVNGLLQRFGDLPHLDGGRPGIVHRLDKDTSGVMVVARTEQALRQLAEDFKERRVEKSYTAVLLRTPATEEGRIVQPIGRHPVHRKKMAIRPIHGRYAASSWAVEERYLNGWCLARIGIETGRTHQIRVHMASLNCPVAADRLYGGKVDANSPIQPQRQLLHATTLELLHPFSRQRLVFTAPLWEDMEACLAQLRQLEP